MSTPSISHPIVSFSEANYREFLESAPDALLLINRAGAILFVNAQAESLFGYTRAELLGVSIEMLLPEQFRARHVEHRAGYCTSPRFRPMGSCMGLYGVRKDGTELPVDISLSYQQTENGLVVLAAIRDVTERKDFEMKLETTVEDRTRELRAVNAQLESASRHKSEFLAHMSHELRTPLNAILGFAELLRDQSYGPLSAKQDRYVGHIHSSGKHLLALINDLLDLSKVEAGKIELRPETFAFHEALTAALTEVRPQADAKRLELELHLDENLLTITADPVRFTQIVLNLLSNAVKFTPEGGTVTVTARIGSSEGSRLDPPPSTLYPGEFVEIAVQDTGIGIKAEDLLKLFQPFTQLETPFVKLSQGTGLGLALTKRLVELHGGQIVAASEGPDRGSTFTVRLPNPPKV